MNFFESYYEAGDDLPEEERKNYFAAIIEFYYTGEEPELTGMAATLWKLTKPTVETSRNRSNSGKKGGRPKEEEKQSAKQNTKQNKKQSAKQTPPIPNPINIKELRDRGGVGEEERREKTPDPQVQEVIDHLNAVCGTKYSATAKPAGHIRARLQEGATVEDCKRVIDLKHREWKGTKMEQYLRPQTLFNGEKFEAYRNQKEVKGDKGDFKGWGRDYDPYARYLAASEGGGD